MKTYTRVYIAIDLHNNHNMVGYMNDKGKYIGQLQLSTNPENLINEVAGNPCRQVGSRVSHMPLIPSKPQPNRQVNENNDRAGPKIM